jgi:hypothetical protein
MTIIDADRRSSSDAQIVEKRARALANMLLFDWHADPPRLARRSILGELGRTEHQVEDAWPIDDASGH